MKRLSLDFGVKALHNHVMSAERNQASNRTWQALAVVGRRPHHYALGPGRDDGDELFDDFDLWVGLRGSCSVRMLDRTLTLRAGRAILIPPGARARQFTDRGQELSMMFVHFDCRIGGEPVREALTYIDADGLRLTLPGVPTLSLVAEVDSEALSVRLRQVRRCPTDDLRQLKTNGVLWDVIGSLREAHLGLSGSVERERLAAAVAFFEGNLERPISLADVAGHVHVSPETLGRLFRAHYQTSPMQYLIGLRMARARELLQNRGYTISQVASACGYASVQYFSRAFKKAFGRPPGAFRRRLPLIP